MGQRSDELRPHDSDVGRPADDADANLDSTTAAAREEIELTRAEMSSTIDAIQDRLDPEVLSEQAKDTAHDVTDYAIREAKEAAREITDHAILQAKDAVRDVTGQATLALREATIGKVETMAHSATEKAGGFRQTALETIKANPLPAALVGLSVGWMLLNRPSGSGRASGTAYEPTGRVKNQVQGVASLTADRVQESAGQMVDQVQDAGGLVIEQVQEQAARAQGLLQVQMQENPLLVGAVAAVIGGVLAATVPSTRREDQLLGETRDRFMGSARELTDDTMGKVARVVGEAQTAAKQEAQKEELIPTSQ